ncbi:hypothetical protein LTS18_011472 [Coniosporium uncinatum]|uniref:Uncharacterized protein n=1 Tax=Coniosporium uncinatum TaxID=93489 RepID=A0ACC3CYK4_9PEZI|nr:hypothetical protein LTS18_011472 [Coniosporium uncinatum]
MSFQHGTLQLSTTRLILSPFNPNLRSHCELVLTITSDAAYKKYEEDFELNSSSSSSSSDDKYSIARSFAEDRLPALNPNTAIGTSIICAAQSHVLARQGFRDRPIGWVTLDQRRGCPAPHLSYAIAPGEQGKGYATEAARELIRYAKEVGGVGEVYGIAMQGNWASKRVLEKLGMRRWCGERLEGFEGKGKGKGRGKGAVLDCYSDGRAETFDLEAFGPMQEVCRKRTRRGKVVENRVWVKMRREEWRRRYIEGLGILDSEADERG